MSEMPEYMTVNQVANFLSVTPYTIRAYLKEGTIAATKTATGRWMVKRADVIAFAEKTYGAQK